MHDDLPARQTRKKLGVRRLRIDRPLDESSLTKYYGRLEWGV